MFPTRKLLGLALLALLGVAAAQAGTASPPPTKASSPTLAAAVARQEQLRRQFAVFKQKLLLTTYRLEASPKAEDGVKAKALRKVLAKINEREVDGKFDVLIRELARPGADEDAETLSRAIAENKGLREALRELIGLMLAGESPPDTREQQEKVEKLLDVLKELRSKQARLRALNEMGRHSPAELGKLQEKIARETDRLLAPLTEKTERDDKLPYDSPPPPPAEVSKVKKLEPLVVAIDNKTAAAKVQEAVAQARRQMGSAGEKLGKGNRDGAADDQGAAVGSLDRAIHELELLLKQYRKEEIERTLANLKQRCERMLQLQVEVRDGTVAIDRDVQGAPEKKPTTGHRAKANVMADREGLVAAEAEAALKMLQGEGSARAFAATFQQLLKDAKTVQNRLNRADTGKVTVTIENAMVETLKEMIEALKKQMQPPPPGGPTPPTPPEDDRRPGKRPLIDLLAELKMVYSLQKRVADRTALYGKEYSGEQAPRPAAGLTAEQREHYAMIRQELAELAESQQQIRGITHSLALAVATRERR